MEKKRSFVSILFVILTSCFISTYSQATPAVTSTDENVETITVIANMPLFRLKREIRIETNAFYDAFNKLNKDSKFEIICRREKQTGSNFYANKCEPRYARFTRSRLSSAGGGMGLDSIRLVSNTDLKVAMKKYKEASLENMLSIMQENPELHAQFLRLQEKVENYKERRASRKW